MSANLEFKILVDEKPGVAGMNRFRQHVNSDLNVVKGDFGRVGTAIKQEMAGVAQSLAASGGAATGMAANFGAAGLALGATAAVGVGVATALFNVAKSAADAGSKFHDLSLQTGVSVETFSGLQLQLKQSGTDMDALARAAVFMQKNLGEAASGNKELQRAFAALGIKDVRAALADTDGTLRTVIKSLGQMESAGERNAAGSKVMGRGFKELSVFLADTKGDLDSVIERAREAGQVMSAESAAAADEFGDQLDALTNAATVAARSFGIEFVPEITKGMTEITGALNANANRWRAWGAEVANVLRGLREVYESEFGQGFRRSVGWLWELNAQTNPLILAYRQIRGMGAQARAGDVTGNAQDLANEMARLASKNTATTPRADVSDFFSAPAKVKREKARKDELDKLKAFAKEWDFVVTSLAGGKHNKGSLHGQGRAMDVSVKGKSAAEVSAFMEAARSAGFGVRDERTRPEGQKVWSGPHIHLQLQSKATRAVVEAESKAFDEQAGILDGLAKAIVDADFKLKAFTDSSVEQQIATEYQRLGIGKLTGEAAELGEAMFAQRAEQIKAAEAAERHAEAIKSLLELAGRYADIDPAALGMPAAVDIPQAAGQEKGPWVDPATLAPPPELFTRWEQFGMTVQSALDTISTSSLNAGEMVGDMFVGVAQGLQQSIQGWLLYGGSIGKAIKQATAAVLAGIAAQSAVKAIFQLAEGFAALFFNPAAAAAHFKAAALYGVAAVAAGVGARAFAGGGGATVAGAGGAFGDGTQQEGQREDFRSRYMREQAEKNKNTQTEDRRGVSASVVQLIVDGKELGRAVLNHVRDGGDLRDGFRHSLGVT